MPRADTARALAPGRRLPLCRAAPRPHRDLRDGVPGRRVRHELPDLRVDDGDRVRPGMLTGSACSAPSSRSGRWRAHCWQRAATAPASGWSSAARCCSRSPPQSRRFMPGYWAYAATLMFTGFAVVTMLTTANGYVQTTTDPALRGRVLALYMAILMGGTPIGAPIVGWVAAEYGPRVGDPRRRRRCARRVRDRRHVAAGLRAGCAATKPGGSASRSTRPCRSGSWHRARGLQRPVASTTPIRLPHDGRDSA